MNRTPSFVARSYLHMIRSLVPLVLALLVVGAQEREADACSCGRATPAMHVANADRVFLARIGEQESIAGKSQTAMEVLFTLKGTETQSFTWKMPSQNPLCGPAYKKGEVHLVFVKGNSVGLCGGNYGMDGQITAMTAFLKASQIQTKPADISSLNWAFAEVLPDYMHGRKRVHVHYTPLAGKRMDASWGTRFRFIRNTRGIRHRKGAIIVDKAISVVQGKHPISLVSGRYPRKGIRFHVLVRVGAKRPEILFSSVSER